MSAVFDFREQQRRTRRGTAILVIVFLLMAAAIGIALGAIASLAITGSGGQSPTIEPVLVAVVGLAVIAFVIVVAVLRILYLGGDGAKVAKSLGAEEVTPENTNAYYRRYLNIVEEMSIAAGLPRPRAFVMKGEQGINAFAAGSDPSRAAVAVTHGALAKLNREELSGVVAHELAHIRNYDTRLNTRLMGLVFGLVVLYVVGRGILQSGMFRGGGNRKNNAVAVGLALAIGFVVLGSLGVLGGRILQSAISRRREYLADATGVAFTRDPVGLANALKKIGGTGEGSRVVSSHREETRHMFFANAASSITGLFSTHPPLVRRIRALEPQFDPATDPIFAMDSRTAMRDARAKLGTGPWDDAPPEEGPWDTTEPSPS